MHLHSRRENINSISGWHFDSLLLFINRKPISTPAQSHEPCFLWSVTQRNLFVRYRFVTRGLPLLKHKHNHVHAISYPFSFFRNLWSWNRNNIRKCEHLFPMWSLLLSGCLIPILHHSQGSSTYGKMESEYPEGGHPTVYYINRESLTSHLKIIIQWRRQRDLTW